MTMLLAVLLLTNDGKGTLSPAVPFEDVTAESNGQWITTRITINTAEDEIDGNTFYGCESVNDVSRSVCFKGYLDLDETVPHVVMGKLRVIHHAPVVIDGEVFEGFTEYRLERAVVVK